MDGELLISLLDTSTDETITADDDSITDLANDNTDILYSTARLELVTTDGERLSFVIESRIGDEITVDDEARTDLPEDNASVL